MRGLDKVAETLARAPAAVAAVLVVTMLRSLDVHDRRAPMLIEASAAACRMLAEEEAAAEPAARGGGASRAAAFFGLIAELLLVVKPPLLPLTMRAAWAQVEDAPTAWQRERGIAQLSACVSSALDHSRKPALVRWLLSKHAALRLSLAGNNAIKSKL